MEELSDSLQEKQKHGRRYGRRSLAFGSGWTALGCIGRNIYPLPFSGRVHTVLIAFNSDQVIIIFR